MNTTSESSLIELRIARAYGKLSSIPVDGSKPSVSLASIGNCEIRMFRGREADLDGMPLFWLELFDHVTKTSVDSFRCDKIKDAAAVFEDFMSQGANLNKPWDEFDPLAVAVDWLDACQIGRPRSFTWSVRRAGDIRVRLRGCGVDGASIALGILGTKA